MLLTQKYHSLNEIDQEFVLPLEQLLHEEWPDFEAWKKAEQSSPADETYTYWLFFGPTQNMPVGMAQLQLKKVDGRRLVPWWKKITSTFDRTGLDWRIARWGIGAALSKPAIFDPRFLRSGKEKLNELFKEIGERPEVMAMTLPLPQGWGALRPNWEEISLEQKTNWKSLYPLQRSHKLYQDYLADLEKPVAAAIQSGWRKLHKEAGIRIGDFPTLASRTELWRECPNVDSSVFSNFPEGLLTFQKGEELLGVIGYRQGQCGTWFYEPMPLEPHGQETVPDQLYVQYAILKAHEDEIVRKMVITRQGSPVRLNSDDEVRFFTEQGFNVGAVEEASWGRNPHLA